MSLFPVCSAKLDDPSPTIVQHFKVQNGAAGISYSAIHVSLMCHTRGAKVVICIMTSEIFLVFFQSLFSLLACASGTGNCCSVPYSSRLAVLDALHRVLHLVRIGENMHGIILCMLRHTTSRIETLPFMRRSSIILTQEARASSSEG